MTKFEFGSFVLDHDARALRLAGREMALQPRVFDLLVYLVRNRERVVSKDELLENVWPGVLVTDGSLQRAISLLRAALREGGMDDAIKSFPRIGYRFHVETAAHEVIAPEPSPDGVIAARRAVGERRWQDAVTLYAAADSLAALSPLDLNGWVLALQCLGKPSDAIPLLIRGITAATEAGDKDAAARSAVSLAAIHLERNESAVAKGWLSRADDLIAGRTHSAVAGLVSWMRARLAATDGETDNALKFAEAAYLFGQQHGHLETEALGLMYRGFYRMSLGDTRAGLADQDHAAALALSAQIDPITGGLIYCNILWSCRTFGDWSRASQWTLGYQQFCAASKMDFSGSCQLHRAEVLGVNGSLREALAHIDEAIAGLTSDAPWAVGDAYRVQGDIQSAIGDTDAALAAYQKAYALGWDPEPGHAMLLLERGEAEAAYVALERSLAGQSWWTQQRRGMLQAHLAVVAVHAGRPDIARAIITELSGQAERWPMASIRALTNEASAVLSRRDGKADEALRHYHLARQLWTSIDSRPHAARLRLAIAALQIEIGDWRGATTEVRAAASASNDLGSDRLKRDCATLTERLRTFDAEDVHAETSTV